MREYKIKRSIIFLTLPVLLLAACGGESPPTTGEAPGPESTLETAAGSSANCVVAAEEPSEETTQASLFPPVSETDWVAGADDAAVTLIEYADFQCPFCAQFAPILAQLQADYPDDLRVVFRHFPLAGPPENPTHDKALLAAQAAEAAGLQGQFWEMHDLLYAKQAEWVELTGEAFTEWLGDEAGDLGLDVEQFNADLTSEALVQLAQQAWEDGGATGIPGIPFLLINGEPYQGPADHSNLSSIISLKVLEGRQFDACPAFAIDPINQYFATLHTAKGDIVIELWPDVAPFAVNSFIFLAENDWYDNAPFHRVLENFMAQGGDPSGTGFGGPGYLYDIETSPDVLFDQPGLIAMANAGPGTNGSQFFITFDPAAWDSGQADLLNGNFTIFGIVIEGMDVVESLTLRDPQIPGQPPGDLILDVSIEVR